LNLYNTRNFFRESKLDQSCKVVVKIAFVPWSLSSDLQCKVVVKIAFVPWSLSSDLQCKVVVKIAFVHGAYRQIYNVKL
jgi:hypothetical protein